MGEIYLTTNTKYTIPNVATVEINYSKYKKDLGFDYEGSVKVHVPASDEDISVEVVDPKMGSYTLTRSPVPTGWSFKDDGTTQSVFIPEDGRYNILSITGESWSLLKGDCVISGDKGGVNLSRGSESISLGGRAKSPVVSSRTQILFDRSQIVGIINAEYRDKKLTKSGEKVVDDFIEMVEASKNGPQFSFIRLINRAFLYDVSRFLSHEAPPTPTIRAILGGRYSTVDFPLVQAQDRMAMKNKFVQHLPVKFNGLRAVDQYAKEKGKTHVR
jgi:hypothetical protein